MSLSPLFFLLLWPQTPMPPPNPGDERPVYGGVPTGPATKEVLELTLVDAIDRGLQRNLALLLGEQRIRAARGARWEALSELLPNVSFKLSETRQKLNLEAFGFTSISGFPDIPALVGPFNVFDARAQLTDTLLPSIPTRRSARSGPASTPRAFPSRILVTSSSSSPAPST